MATIYIGEDSPAQAAFVRGHLRRESGLEIELFDDGLDLYLAVQESPPDLILSDIVLPTMGGLAVARLLKFHETYEAIPMILMSTMSVEDVGDLKRVGADVFLPKPVRAEELRETVMALLGRGSTTG